MAEPMNEESGYRASQAAAGRRRRISWAWSIVLLLIVFLFGMLASPWLEARVRGWIPALQPAQQTAEAERLAQLELRMGQLEADADRPPPLPPISDQLMERLNAIEARASTEKSSEGEIRAQLETLAADIERVGAEVAIGDAQLRDIFLLAVVRRMVESGRPLGETGEILARRYRPVDAASVDALLAWSAAPQTVQTLSARLRTMNPDLQAADQGGDFWSRIRAGFSRLVTVRDDSAADPAAALAAARQALEDDDIGLAIGALKTAPMDPERRQWVADAQLLASSGQALLKLETMALNEASHRLSAQAGPGATPDPVNVAPAKVPEAG